MKLKTHVFVTLIISIFILSCKQNSNAKKEMQEEKQVTAKEILGNPEYLAMSYGGYRDADHDVEPAIDELKEDLKLLSAMGIKIMRTYKVHLPQAWHFPSLQDEQAISHLPGL